MRQSNLDISKKVAIDYQLKTGYSTLASDQSYQVFTSKVGKTVADRNYAKYAAFLGIQGNRLDNTSHLGMNTDGKILSVGKNDGFTTFHIRPNAAKTALISEEDSAVLATKLIRTLGLTMGSPVLFRTSTHGVSRYNIASKTSEESIVERGFIFKRIIDGIPAYGPGTMASVELSTSGELVGGKIDWPEIQPVKKVSLSDPKEAVVGLEKALIRINRSINNESRVVKYTLKDLKIRYISQVTPEGTLEIKPAYAAVGDVLQEDGKTKPGFAVFLSASQEYPVFEQSSNADSQS